MRLKAHGASDTGRVRPGNEDRFHVGTTLFAVADGLGGHAAGEVASALAIEAITELDGRPMTDADQAKQALRDAFARANEKVARAAADEPSWEGMGTTLTAALAVGDEVQLAHVGDSRAYLLPAEGELRQLTDDHTVATELIRSGRLTPEEAAAYPELGALIQAVGLQRDMRIDTPRLELAAGDRLLLCSDGLTGVVGEQRITALLRKHPEPEPACQALIEAANAAGGPDNITVVLLVAEPSDSP